MTYENAYKPITDYLWKEYPNYEGWRIRSFAWEYDISSLPSEIYNALSDEFDANGHITVDSVEEHIETVQPPEGFVYVTLQKDDVRVGFNVPVHVFRD